MEVNMKVLALACSPRIAGNSDVLLDKCIEGLKINQKDITVEKVYIDKLNINPCKACDYCKNENIGHCIHNDDMTNLVTLFKESDLWIIATPIYWWGPTAQLKLVMDRWYSFYKYSDLEKKKAGIIITMGDSKYKTAIPTILMFEMTFSYLNISSHQPLVITAYDKGEVLEKTEALQDAFNYGKRLISF